MFHPDAILHKWTEGVVHVGLDDQTMFLDEAYRLALGQRVCRHTKMAPNCACRVMDGLDVEGVAV